MVNNLDSEGAGAAAELCGLLGDTPHDTFPQLGEKMGVVTAALPAARLESAVPFAQAYTELTLRANKAFEAGVFDDPETTEKLATNFAGRYFDALAGHLRNHNESVPHSWRQLFATEDNQPPWLKLALGVNAHIGHDLPLALRQTAVTHRYRESFSGINRAIKNIAPELAPDLLPTVAHRPRVGVAAVAARVIIGWRERAWQDFMQLEQGKTNPTAIEISAARRGSLLQKTSKMLGIVGVTGA